MSILIKEYEGLYPDEDGFGHTKFYSVYVVSIDDAFSAFVVKKWGPIGRGPIRYSLERYDSHRHALQAATALCKKKAGRGYVLTEKNDVFPSNELGLAAIFNAKIYAEIMTHLGKPIVHLDEPEKPKAKPQATKTQEDELWGIW